MGVHAPQPEGRAAARGLDARLSLQQAFMPAGDASLKQLRSIKMLIDSNHGIYRYRYMGYRYAHPYRYRYVGLPVRAPLPLSVHGLPVRAPLPLSVRGTL